MSHLLCLFTPTGCVATAIAKASVGDLFDALTGWIVASVQWILSAAGSVLLSASEPSTVVRSATQEFDALLVLSPILVLIGLLVSTLQALRHGDPSSLWTTYLGVAPACVIAIALARPLASLVLEAVNQVSSTAAITAVQHETSIATAFANIDAATPSFGLFLLAVGVVVATWMLWCELIVRTVVLTMLLVLVPVIVPLSTFPSLRRVSWRLAETFLAVAFSKFLIVVALSLGLDELQGSSTTQVVTGAVTILLATLSPFILLRLVPLVEQSALHNLEGLRGRLTDTAKNAPSSPVGAAARLLVPAADLPGPEERPLDMGLEMWPAGPEFEPPPYTGVKMDPPIGKPTPRGGHVAYRSDEMGPVVGWHFDE